VAFVSGLVAAGVLAASLLGPATKGHADTDSAVPAGLGDSACPAVVNGLNLTTATIPELRAALDSGEISSRELVEGYLARVDALNRRGPKLKPVITTAPDALEQAEAADAARAAGAAQGPLAGIPILLKDNVDTTDFQTTAGAKAMLGPAPPLDAFLTSRLREAGAIVLGKANMDEWATEIDPRQPKRILGRRRADSKSLHERGPERLLGGTRSVGGVWTRGLDRGDGRRRGPSSSPRT
jgi:amidase